MSVILSKQWVSNLTPMADDFLRCMRWTVIDLGMKGEDEISGGGKVLWLER
jgi:hypothetical protein